MTYWPTTKRRQSGLATPSCPDGAMNDKVWECIAVWLKRGIEASEQPEQVYVGDGVATEHPALARTSRPGAADRLPESGGEAEQNRVAAISASRQPSIRRVETLPARLGARQTGLRLSRTVRSLAGIWKQ